MFVMYVHLVFLEVAVGVVLLPDPLLAPRTLHLFHKVANWFFLGVNFFLIKFEQFYVNL